MAGVREQDHYMPIANVIRIMRRILPAHAKISDDAKEMIQECVSEYISFITAEANERCQQEQRKTVTADDVLWAMEKLGFDDYARPLAVYLQRYRESEGEPASVRRASASASASAPPPPVLRVPPSVVVPGDSHSHSHPHPHPPYPHGFSLSEFDPSPQGFFGNDASPSADVAANFLPGFDPYAHMNIRRDSM
ncbi:nuclear transcription factor Y subunit B-1 [Cajanus cajan]|uniref:Nuclear transcription factor Y subunit B-6 n=1 Tax=Cajanus cajan TaxID=3821 RepID=A0A151RTB6_CAJCA|nr:nuclear transcription factor Y subunit B-1 [Cajanus cajan]KYP45790.1 Nuclear transcription factor Y subunit B-6 [Cajanus cajan]